MYQKTQKYTLEALGTSTDYKVTRYNLDIPEEKVAK